MFTILPIMEIVAWTDFVRAESYGGIHLPYGYFTDEVQRAMDNAVGADPQFARFAPRLKDRDFVLITGEHVCVFAVSTGMSRRLPLYAVEAMPNLLGVPEMEFVEKSGGAVADTRWLPYPDLRRFFEERFDLSDPVVVRFPNIFKDPKVYRESAEAKITATILLLEDRKRFEEKLEMEKPKEIFLSHKTVDKPLVREVAATLTAIGFSPWLDEDKMKAGTNLERGLRQGFKDSCAAVFFVTPNFTDENYLASEVDYAIAEKRNKGDRFSIITLLLEGEDGSHGEVPILLQPYVYKRAKEVEVIRHIVEALPIRMVAPQWKD